MIKMVLAISLALILQTFVLLNPLASFPVLIEAYKRKMNVRKMAINAIITAFIIAIIIALVGPYLFTVFGITLDSFRIAGGIILLLLGIEMINPRDEKVGTGKVDGMTSIIATPLLTGPATMSFLTIKAYELGQTPVIINLVGAFILVGAVFFIFSLAVSKINSKAVGIVSKIIGLFLAGVAIEMISRGIVNILAL